MIFSTKVNFEFDTDEDLLAVDSSLSNEVPKIDSTHYYPFFGLEPLKP